MALIRAVREDQVNPAEQQLAEELELLTATQRTRLEGGSRLRRLARRCFFFFVVLILPLVAFMFTAGPLERYLGDFAMVVGSAVLAAIVIAGLAGSRSLERAGAAAELERKRRAVARLRQLDVSSVSSSSSVAVPVMSSVHQRK